MAKPGQSMWASVLSPQALEETTPLSRQGVLPESKKADPGPFVLWLGVSPPVQSPSPQDRSPCGGTLTILHISP